MASAICCGVMAEPRQLRVRYFDEDVLVRVAKVVDLVDTGHAQQDRAQLIRVVVQLRGRKAVAFERIDVRVDVTELVVEERSEPSPWATYRAMSPTFLRTWYQVSGTSLTGAESFMAKKIIDSPGRE